MAIVIVLFLATRIKLGKASDNTERERQSLHGSRIQAQALDELAQVVVLCWGIGLRSIYHIYGPTPVCKDNFV